MSPPPSGLAEPAATSPPARRERRVGVRCDDVPAGRAWAQALAAEGLQVQVQAIDDAAPPPSDALVLHISGALSEQLSRLRGLRQQAPHTPLLIALRGLRELDQVLSLEMGADDAVDTSASPPVVAARLRAQWRRALPPMAAEMPTELRFGELELRLLRRETRLAGREVPLTEGEFEVLWLLANHAGQTLSRRELLRRVRGLDDHPMDRSIDNRVYRIRAKLGDDALPAQRIRTVRNRGYMFCPTGW